MKKIIFLSAMFASIATSAQTLNIKITNIDYSTKMVMCDLSWTARDDKHRADVWVFVDYIEISDNTTTGGWKPAAINGATVTTKTIGNATASTVSGNTRGVWIKSPTYGAAFTGQIAVQLGNIPDKFKACAYASDYPPNAASYNGGTYTLRGTQPFTITGNGTIQNGNKYVGTTITSMTDATGCPGGVGRDIVHNGGTCAPGLTAVGGYCRDLAADGASTNVSCGFEVKLANSTIGAGCPSGWSIARMNQLGCMRGKNTEFGITEPYYRSDETTGAGHKIQQTYCTNCYAILVWWSYDANDWGWCSTSCGYCVNGQVQWHGICDGSGIGTVGDIPQVVKCIR
jgi:hypothetical protein